MLAGGEPLAYLILAGGAVEAQAVGPCRITLTSSPAITIAIREEP
jgi:hypothetical protein